MSDVPGQEQEDRPDEFGRLVEGWLDGTLDRSEEARLGAFVAADPAAAASLARATLVHDRLRDLLRGGMETFPASAPKRDSRGRGWRGAWFAIPAALAALVVMAGLFVRSPEASASAALQRVVRAIAAGDREYVVRVLDHGPAGPVVVPGDSEGRKPGVDGARLWVGGTERFVLERAFGDGTLFVNGCDGVVGWSVPPTGHVHLSRDTARFRRGIPGEEADIPFIALPENLLRLGRGYDLRLDPVLADGTRRLVADRQEKRRSGPERVTILLAADGTPLLIDLEGLGADPVGEPTADAGPQRVSLELVSRAPLDPSFFAHEHHHAPDRPIDWE